MEPSTNRSSRTGLLSAVYNALCEKDIEETIHPQKAATEMRYRDGVLRLLPALVLLLTLPCVDGKNGPPTFVGGQGPKGISVCVV